MLCHVMLCYVMLSCAMSCQVVLSDVMFCYAMCHVVLLCCIVLCGAALRCVHKSEHKLVLCQDVLFYDMICYDMSYVMLCRVLLCCVVLRCVVYTRVRTRTHTENTEWELTIPCHTSCYFLSAALECAVYVLASGSASPCKSKDAVEALHEMGTCLSI